MLGDRRSRAVIDIEAWVHRLEHEALLLAGSRPRRNAAATGTGPGAGAGTGTTTSASTGTGSGGGLPGRTDGCPDGREIASINGDRAVTSIDLSQVAQAFGLPGAPPYFAHFDINLDRKISSIDLSTVAQRFGAC